MIDLRSDTCSRTADMRTAMANAEVGDDVFVKALEALSPKGEDYHVEHADDERRDEPRKGMLRRHPFAFLGTLILLFVALPAGYLYWDYASHFESTDDAFIAARQFTIAPKVPGYLTAVPVTDNEHVVAGQ